MGLGWDDELGGPHCLGFYLAILISGTGERGVSATIPDPESKKGTYTMTVLKTTVEVDGMGVSVVCTVVVGVRVGVPWPPPWVVVVVVVGVGIGVVGVEGVTVDRVVVVTTEIPVSMVTGGMVVVGDTMLIGVAAGEREGQRRVQSERQGKKMT